MKLILKSNFKELLLLFIVSPVFFWTIWRFPLFVSEWSKIFGYTQGNLSSMLAKDKLQYVEDMRWNSPLSGIVYNKGLVLVDDFFSYISFFSPRFYFQAGDGTGFTPSSVEPVAGPLFVFWVLGLISFIRKKDFRFFVLVFLLGLPAFLAGRRNIAFLFPVLVLYIFIAYEGIRSFVSSKNKKFILIAYVVYSLFLIGRVLWFTSKGF